MKNIHNFSIIAHIDHSKSTLSDHIIQIYSGLSDHEMEAQVLNSMDLEHEHGITIKAQSMTLDYKASDSKTYQLNFINTPGHIDFSYEVSHSLAACEGALLVVNTRQGMEAQTLANCYTTMEMDLKVVPVLNKIDLPAANPEHVAEEIEDIISINTTDTVHCSAKTSVGMQDILKHLVHDIPPPEGNPEGPLQALIINSWFNNYLGIVSLIHIKNSTLHKGNKVKVMSTRQTYNTNHLGIFTPKQVDHTELKCGKVGWLICAIKDIHSAPVSNTLTLAHNPAEKALPGFKKVKPQVYTSLFPVSSNNYEAFHDTLGKLSLNNASLFYEPESSSTLGFGFHCSFLGLLHMEIIQEHLEHEYNLDLITTAPTIVYEVETTSREVIYINSPSKLPTVNNIYKLHKPIAECHMLLPQAYLSNIITLCIEKHSMQTNMVYHSNQVALTYKIPMAEVVLNFFNQLKSTSQGYASLDYNFKHFQASNMVHVDILINSEHVDALALITHHDNSQNHSHKLVEKMKDLIPRQQFDIAIQAAIGTHIIAQSTMKQLHKNILAKCYGSDISHKKKLLQKQKEGKKHMKQISNIKLPQEAFLTILHISKDNK